MRLNYPLYESGTFLQKRRLKTTQVEMYFLTVGKGPCLEMWSVVVVRKNSENSLSKKFYRGGIRSLRFLKKIPK